MTSYAYNTLAFTKTLNYPGKRVVVEEREKRDRLIAVKENGAAIATLTYDGGDRLTKKVFANGFSEQYIQCHKLKGFKQACNTCNI